jgi:hypothetical protein
MDLYNIKNRLLLALYFIIPLVLFFIPLDWLNKQHTICLVKNIFGVNCFGCGITRAVISGIQLDFDKSFEYNKMVIIVLPLLIYVWCSKLINLIRTESEPIL